MVSPRLPLLFLGLLLAFPLGCGPARIDRAPVGGEVTLDGAPLESGYIAFQPLAGGPSAGGEINGGRFSIPREEGPSPADYRVEIISYKSTGRQIADPDRPGQTTEEKRQIIPAKYNAKSDLQVTIPAGGKLDMNFPLTSR